MKRTKEIEPWRRLAIYDKTEIGMVLDELNYLKRKEKIPTISWTITNPIFPNLTEVNLTLQPIDVAW